MWPNETRDLICIGAADYGELYPATTHVKEVGDPGSGSPGVELHARIAPLPEVDPPVQLVRGYFTEVVSPNRKRKHRGVAQLRFFDRLLDNVVVAG